MIRIWFYGLLIKYYAYCYHKWIDIVIANGNNQSKAWAKHYEEKLRNTHMKKEAYKYYISLRRL